MPDPRLGPYSNWTISPLTGDASSRRYARLAGPDGETAIFMDAAAEPAQTFHAFQSIASHLTTIDVAAPRVYWADNATRLMVIEDLGPRQFAEWLTVYPDDAERLYSVAIDVLVRIQSAPPPPGLIALTPTRAAGMIGPLFDWYVTAPDIRTAALITGGLQQALTDHAPRADYLALRDFHAENLIWRPDQGGTDAVGLLDFQDAVLAPPEYDLVSLLRDARRDVGDDLRDAMIARFATLTNRDPMQVRAAAAVLGVQRNLRILGIFAKLAKQSGKLRYLDLLPRVWSHVTNDLTHPALDNIRPLILATVPPPDQTHMNRLQTA